MTWRAGCLALACTGAAACSQDAPPRRGEILLHVDTDLAVPELASRLRVDVYSPSGEWFESREIFVGNADVAGELQPVVASEIGGCKDDPPEGADDGTPCETQSDCKGFCVGVPGVDAFCASLCSAAGELDSEDCGGSGNGFCNASYQSNSPGSLGYCYVGCTSHADCAQPFAFCIPPTLERPNEPEPPPWWDLVEHVCFVVQPCSNLGADCGGGFTCVDTPFGPRCLDPTVPWTPP